MTQSAAKSQRGNAAQGGVGVAKVTKLCCQVLLDPTEHRIVRTEAARVLQEVDAADHCTAEALCWAVQKETDRFVRRSLVDAAAHFAAHRSAVEALLALSQDSDRFVRDAAVAALADRGEGEATLIEDGHKKKHMMVRHVERPAWAPGSLERRSTAAGGSLRDDGRGRPTLHVLLRTLASERYGALREPVLWMLVGHWLRAVKCWDWDGLIDRSFGEVVQAQSL
ncbi:unnamed protein product [Cladocopium goreaui]|uniref:HEAT repeat domain-containing protein n=1 Tax=Cladocopium goreaui TaxID=2562237 RepID=A0A9P1DAY5_9DINO|nr:unnamed protein product [Cladocopium goreaui]